MLNNFVIYSNSIVSDFVIDIRQFAHSGTVTLSRMKLLEGPAIILENIYKSEIWHVSPFEGHIIYLEMILLQKYSFQIENESSPLIH